MLFRVLKAVLKIENGFLGSKTALEGVLNVQNEKSKILDFFRD